MKTTKEDKSFLALYSDSIYEKPSVTVDAVIFRISEKKNENYRKLPEKKLQVFLTKRRYSPYKNKFAVIGTFIDLKHELSETMQLCVKNKVGLDNYYFEQLFTFGEKTRDPRTRVLSVSYMLLTNKEEYLQNGEWFDVCLRKTTCKKMEEDNGYSYIQNYELILSGREEVLTNLIEVSITKKDLKENKVVKILKSPMAFDHSKIVFIALERLKNKLEYTDIIFNLLPQYFTLTELKKCYEIILNEKLLDANFRRKTSHMVCATDKFEEAKGHRISKLFIHNPNWRFSSLD